MQEKGRREGKVAILPFAFAPLSFTTKAQFLSTLVSSSSEPVSLLFSYLIST